MEHGINKMDKVYFYNDDLYIRINDKNDHLLELDDVYDDILVWNIQHKLENVYIMYRDFLMNNELVDCDDSWCRFKEEILSSLQYKVYKRIGLL